MSTRAHTTDGAKEKENGSFRDNEVEHNVCNCIQKSNFTFTYTSRCVTVAVSQRTLPIMLLINEKKKRKMKKKLIRYSNRESNLVVMIFRILLSFIV